MATPPTFSAGAVLTAAQMNAIGMWRVASGTLSTATTDFQSVFTSDFTNYRIVMDQLLLSGAGDIYWRLLSGSTPATGTDYGWAFNGYTSAPAAADSGGSNQSLAYTGVTMTAGVANLRVSACTIDLMNPQVAERTFALTQAATITNVYRGLSGAAAHNLTTAYDGIRFLTNSAVTMGGNVTIYGYRKP